MGAAVAGDDELAGKRVRAEPVCSTAGATLGPLAAAVSSPWRPVSRRKPTSSSAPTLPAGMEDSRAGWIQTGDEHAVG